LKCHSITKNTDLNAKLLESVAMNGNGFGASFRAISSSRISRTVSGTMALPVCLKNLSTSVRASRE